MNTDIDLCFLYTKQAWIWDVSTVPTYIHKMISEAYESTRGRGVKIIDRDQTERVVSWPKPVCRRHGAGCWNSWTAPVLSKTLEGYAREGNWEGTWKKSKTTELEREEVAPEVEFEMKVVSSLKYLSSCFSGDRGAQEDASWEWVRDWKTLVQRWCLMSGVLVWMWRRSCMS